MKLFILLASFIFTNASWNLTDHELSPVAGYTVLAISLYSVGEKLYNLHLLETYKKSSEDISQFYDLTNPLDSEEQDKKVLDKYKSRIIEYNRFYRKLLQDAEKLDEATKWLTKNTNKLWPKLHKAGILKLQNQNRIDSLNEQKKYYFERFSLLNAARAVDLEPHKEILKNLKIKSSIISDLLKIA